MLLLAALVCLLPWSPAIRAAAERDFLAEAQGAAAREDWAACAETLEEALARARSGPALLALYGEALLALERRDEAAHYLESALEAFDPKDREVARLARLLRAADPLAGERRALFEKIVEVLLDSAGELAASGHVERALDVCLRLEPIARDAEQVELQALLAELRARTTVVDLDDAAAEELAPGEWPVFELESAHYRIEANLEPSVVELVGATMDDIFGYYVQIYFGGDEGRVDSRKATIRIYPTSKAMLATWTGDNQPGGWWSPGEWTVVCYDTRTSYGQSLDGMLETLFHEASHQFMTMRAQGGSPPAWLNEGTATFFEGAKAMADRRVLWPEAARGRLANLVHMLAGESAPTLADVVGYDEPGSYDPPYYAYGWGLVYFLQQYEDEATLERVYRAPYLEYMERISERGGDPRELFDELFTGPDSPQRFASFEEFAAFWEKWILETVLPLYEGPDVQARRWALARRYVEAAEASAKAKGPKKAQEQRAADLYARALEHLEYLREARGPEAPPDGELLATAARVLDRLGRPESAAPLLEELLDLADAGGFELSAEDYAAHSERLRAIDRKNAALREAESRAAGFAKSAAKLLGEYAEAGLGEPFALRRYTLARLAGLALDDRAGLLASSLELREEARAAGLLLGTIADVAGAPGDWITVYSEDGTAEFEAGPGRAALAAGGRSAGRICTAVPVRGEYEVRAALGRPEPQRRSTVCGLVVSGTKDGDWIAVGFDGQGRLSVRRIDLAEDGSSVDRVLRGLPQSEPLAEGAGAGLRVHAYPEGRLVLTIDERAPLEIDLGEPLPATAHVGIYAKDGKAELGDVTVEIFP